MPQRGSGESADAARPAGGAHVEHEPRRFDWLILVGTTWMIVGLYLDGWAHRHVPGLESFFTPWHGVLYSGLAVTTGFLVGLAWTRTRSGLPWRRALPRGYALSLTGALIFGVSGVLDMFWHLAFGIEESIDALLSPSHLGLALGFVLLLSGPLLSPETVRRGRRHRFADLPKVLTVAYLVGVLAFFTQYAHPLVEPLATLGGAETTGPASSVFLHRIGTSQHVRVDVGMPAGQSRPELSPDGDRLAFSAAPDGDLDIFVVSPDGSGLRALTHGPEDDRHPTWSPDGRRIAYLSTHGHLGSLRVQDLDRGEVVTLVDDRVDLFGPPSWSPDGTSLLYTVWGDRGHELMMIDVDTKVERDPLTSPDGWEEVQGSIAPDGEQVAFSGLHEQNADIFVSSLAKPQSRRVIVGSDARESFPAWSPDGNSLVFTREIEGVGELHVVDLASGSVTQVTNSPGTKDDHAAWSRDGAWIAYASEAAGTDFSGLPLSEILQGLGVAAILLQTVILMTGVVFVLRRFEPFLGTVSLMVVVPTALAGLLGNTWWYLPGAVLIGIAGDAWLKLRQGRGEASGSHPGLAFGIPAAYAASYFLTLEAVGMSVAWPIELPLGAILLAGACGVAVERLLGRAERADLRRSSTPTRPVA